MTVKGLGKLIKSRAPGAIIWEKNIRMKRLAIDARLLLYTFVISGRGKNGGADIVTSSGRVSSHIHGIYEWIMNSIEYETDTVWVFDGPPPIIKRNALKKRAISRSNAKKKVEELQTSDSNSNSNDIIKYKKKAVEINDNITNEVQELLTLFGIPYMNALSEGEMQCAAFGKTHWTISEDWDSLVFGSSNMVKKISFNRNMLMRISLRNVLDELGLTHGEFIELCILMGCDYCPKISGVNFDIYDVYKRFKNVEGFVNYLHEENQISILATGEIKYDVPDDYITTVYEVKTFYLEGLVINPSSNKLCLTWNKPDYEGIINFVCNKFELDYDMVTRDMEYVKKMYNRNIYRGSYYKQSYSNHFSSIRR